MGARREKRTAPSGEAFRRAVGETIERDLAPLPYAVIENDIKGTKASAELIGEALLLGGIREVMQPMVDAAAAYSVPTLPRGLSTRVSAWWRSCR